MNIKQFLLVIIVLTLFPAKNLDCLEKDSKKEKEAAESPDTAGTGKTKDELKKEKNAEIHFDRGVDFFRDGMISAALAEFLKSYNEVPQWAVLYNVGVCYYRLGKYDESIKFLSQYMEEGGDEIPPERRFAVEKLKIKMAASYGSIVIDYKLPGVRVTIDGKTTYKTPVGDAIPVAAGIHTIYMYRDGHYPVLAEVSVASGEEVVVPVKLELTPLMEAWLTDTGRLEYLGKKEKIKKLETATWVLFGTSLALGISSVVAGSFTYKLKQDQNSELLRCDVITSEEDCPEAFDIEDKGNKWKWATNGLIAATGVMIAATFTLWVVKKVKLKKILDEGSIDITANSEVTLHLTAPGLISISW